MLHTSLFNFNVDNPEAFFFYKTIRTRGKKVSVEKVVRGFIPGFKVVTDIQKPGTTSLILVIERNLDSDNGPDVRYVKILFKFHTEVRLENVCSIEVLCIIVL